MKRIASVFLFLLFYCCSCNSKQSSGKADSDIDAARQFIRTALDGKFSEARGYMLADSANENYMEVAERNYEKADDQTRNGYRDATIHIHLVRPLNDSTTIVIYSNSFKNDHDTLRVLKTNGQWLIDLKYLYEHDSDTLSYSSLNKNESVIAPDVDSTLKRAKRLSSIIFNNVEKVDENLMTKKQLKKLCDPMQKELDSLTKKLTLSQNEELKVYRTNLVSEMVDRKVERDRKKQ